jgi:predicted protein tyrosine phosphatase
MPDLRKRDYVRALTCGTISRVDEDVLIGGYLAAADPQQIETHRITHIVKLFPDSAEYPGGEHHHKKVDYHVVDANDVPDFRLDKHFLGCLQFMQKAIKNGGTILVHCHAGVSRSATIVLLHRMINHGQRLKDAMDHLRRSRSFVNPNAGFWSMLEDVDRRASKFRRDGSAPRRPDLRPV